MTRHFLTLLDLSPEEANDLIERAIFLKRQHREQQIQDCCALKHRVLGMLFEKSSTRTRVSFESAMMQSGGGAIFLSPSDTQLGRGEPIEDTAKVVSSMVDILILRTFSHERIQKFAAHSQVPVINALTDSYHPCQLLADMQTFFEYRGSIAGRTVAWVGDGNNMCHSYINAARQFDFELRIATPAGFEPDADILAASRGQAKLYDSPQAAVAGAHLITTDVWASMGQESQAEQRSSAFSAFQVCPALLNQAAEDVLFMHCLPAHRGEEISHDLLEDARSVVWVQAENRLHAQRALLEFLLLQKKEVSVC